MSPDNDPDTSDDTGEAAIDTTTIDDTGEWIDTDELVDTDSIEETDTDDDTEPTDVADTEEVIEANCWELYSDFRAYVDAHNACVYDAECVVVGGAGSCDCAPALTGSGAGINRDALDGLSEFYARLEMCERFSTVCDAAPGENLGCVDGQCRVRSRSCMTPQDTGFPDTDTGVEDTE